MELPNVFTPSVAQQLTDRIQKLSPGSTPNWGKMSVAQMLAHCSVTYEMIYENKHPKPGAFMRFILKTLVKKKVVNAEPYGQNGQTAPQFIIKDDKNFEAEKNRLIGYITQTQELGETHFDGKESHSFGVLTKNEWNNMMYKHLDHHFRQFGV